MISIHPSYYSVCLQLVLKLFQLTAVMRAYESARARVCECVTEQCVRACVSVCGKSVCGCVRAVRGVRVM